MYSNLYTVTLTSDGVLIQNIINYFTYNIMTKKGIKALSRFNSSLSKALDILDDINFSYLSIMTIRESAQLSEVRRLLDRLSDEVTTRLCDNTSRFLDSH